MKNLYRRYRPLKLAEVVGQDQVTEPLRKALEAGKVAHAYLFVGPRGCGKTSVARILAHEVNDFEYKLEDDYVDIIEIDGASNRGIDNIRELREKAMVAPTMGKYKIYIIDEVHMLTKEAFNALLKTLEEPPMHVLFIMATTDAYKVPVTITSRAQTYTFKLADTKTMLGYLKEVCDKEGIKIEDAALEIIARRGGGSFRDSLSLLDQISTLSNDKITKEMVTLAMGLPSDELVSKLLDAYIEGDVVKITTILQDSWSFGIKPETLSGELISAIIKNPRSEFLSLLAKLPEVKAPYAEARILVALLGGQPLSNPPLKNTSSKKPLPIEQSSENRISGEQPQNSSSKTSVSSSTPKTPDVSSPSTQPIDTIENSSEPASTDNASFDWESFIAKVREMSEAVYSQLIKTQHELKNETLHIYPTKKIVKSILSRDNNKRILTDISSNIKIIIHDPEDTPTGAEKDVTLSKISAIMGGEVINDGGGNPFE